MIKTLIQVAIVALLLNAAFQTARSYYSFHDFKAKLAEETHHGRLGTTSQLHQKAIDLAEGYGLQVPWENVQVRLEAPNTVVDVSYIDRVVFVPRLYYRDWPYSFSVSRARERPLKDDDQR
jgi:hypothetical protein